MHWNATLAVFFYFLFSFSFFSVLGIFVIAVALCTVML